VVGDSVNLAQRIQQWAGPGETVVSEPTYDAMQTKVECEQLPAQEVKGRVAPVGGYRIAADGATGA
jgi:class 3 adenylate cyclase